MLETHGSCDQTYRRELRLLLAETLGRQEAWVFAHGETEVSPADAATFADLAERRRRGEPVAYLLGRREFFGREFLVDRRVLIPRPETEHLIERALEMDLPSSARVLDIGTGSGCIAITLACERPDWRLVSSDLSLSALAVAQKNADRHSVGHIHFVAADLADAVNLGTFDLIVSNPPYVDLNSASTLSPDVFDFEPHLALFPESPSKHPGDSPAGISPTEHGDGLLVYRRLLAGSRDFKTGALVLLEIGYGQLAEVEALAAAAEGLFFIAAHQDLAGIPRIVELRATQPGK